MALTVTKTLIHETRSEVVYRLAVTFDASYPTGGESLDLSSVMGTLNYCTAEVSDGYTLDFNTYSGATCKIEMWYSDYDAVADGNLIEVPNTTDIATVVVSVIAHGTIR